MDMPRERTNTRYLLAEFLFATPKRTLVAVRALQALHRWRAAVEMAKAWKVLPHFFARLQEARVELAPADHAILKRELLHAYAFSSHRALRAVAAIRSVEEAGIRVIAFKGLASIALIYRDPRRRTIQDADLLISREDLFMAVACLERNGFSRKSPASLEEYTEFVENAPGFAGNKAVALYGKDGEIDLHWELSGSGLRTQDILDRSVHADFNGAIIRVADPADALLLTVHHAIRENLAIESICRDIMDVRQWLDILERQGRIETVVQRSVESGCQASLLAILEILSNYETMPGVAGAAALLQSVASKTERRSARRLTELFQYQLHHGRLEKDVFYIVHVRPWRQIL
jgi:hypothetical protein